MGFFCTAIYKHLKDDKIWLPEANALPSDSLFFDRQIMPKFQYDKVFSSILSLGNVFNFLFCKYTVFFESRQTSKEDSYYNLSGINITKSPLDIVLIARLLLGVC